MSETENNTLSMEAAFKPNRKMRRMKAPVDKSAKRTQRRWDKVLAKHYGIPKAFRAHAAHHRVSVELMLSNLLGAGAIKYKELPEDKEASIYWRKA